MTRNKLTHLDERGRPRMVDVGGKAVTRRTAHARVAVAFPPEAARHFAENEYSTAKGPVFHTAIVAGVLAAKRTHELIPFCHPLGIEDCDIQIAMEGNEAVIDCRVSLHGQTGVEMEALTGASVAALTVYDMCKSLSKGLVIRETKLLEKTGGKSGDWRAA
ncbi:MAG TPA: cyclic pyranopterin monophosphate synthase MoaC [Gammaproteobacteria bacterium]|nr:cyclic pyranopterin monophosphate synthase MoaC [Gammaproteobacteria bacterium]HRP86406.1 cyclic pyranopterin monophosphate synthase MoaC [Gammaproteobacteria bacterium]